MNRNIKDASEIREAFSSLARKIHEISSGADVYYCLNPGNLGDALIREGSERFFSDFGIVKKNIRVEGESILLLSDEYKELESIPKSLLRDSILIYAGGGGWCNVWARGRRTVEKISTLFRHTIVLPSTYEKPVNLEHVTLYARDRYESMQNATSALFCHDMAFYLLFSMPYSIELAKRKNVSFCFRKDEESGINEHWHIPLSNVDISWKGNYLDSPLVMLEHVANYKQIHTDRLHVAVSCCLTGTKFYLYPNSYFKNRAIFLTTIVPYFTIGVWRESLPLYMRITNSVERRLKKVLNRR